MFWNAYGNIQGRIESTEGYDYNRELLTYIQADDRYLSYVDEYLATATDLPEPAEDIRARAVAEHETSFNVLETSEGYSTDVQGLANDFYFVIEQEYPDTAPAADTTAEAAPAVVAEPAYFFLQESQPTLTAMGDFGMPETAPLAGTTFGLNPEIVADIGPAFLEEPQPVMTLMGDFAMPDAGPTLDTTVKTTPEIVAEPTLVIVEESPPVMTAAGDFAMPGTSIVVETPPTVTTTIERPYDEDFARTQLGDLAEPPQEEFSLVTESIAPEVMPVPVLEEIQPDTAPVIASELASETSAETTSSIAEDTSTSTDHAVKDGDSLWSIAKEHYNIERGNYESNAEYTAALQNAVSHIASATGLVTAPNGKNYDLTVGANAGHIYPGQVMILPPAEELALEPETSLDFHALDKGGRIEYSAALITPGFNAGAAGKTPAQPALAGELSTKRTAELDPATP